MKQENWQTQYVGRFILKYGVRFGVEDSQELGGVEGWEVNSDGETVGVKSNGETVGLKFRR